MSIVTTAERTPATAWSIDPTHSSVEFSVRHLMITTVRGRFTGVKGTVAIDESDPAKSAVEVVIDAASVDTREAQRDAHLRSADFFDVERFPTLTFRSTRLDGAIATGFKLAGDLTIHGVTRPVVLEVQPEGQAKDPWGGLAVRFHRDDEDQAERLRPDLEPGAGGRRRHGERRGEDLARRAAGQRAISVSGHARLVMGERWRRWSVGPADDDGGGTSPPSSV